MRSTRLLPALSLWLACIALPVGAGAADRPDPWITLKTKVALMTADGVHAGDVNVDTVNGRVTLHGKVRTDAERTRAKEVAQGIEGVREVRDLLQVVPASSEPATKASDEDLKTRVAQALRDDASLADSHVEVASVNKGVVLLRGSATSLGDQYAAVADAHRVAGVDRVASEITAPGALSDEDVWVEPDRSTARIEKRDAKKAAEARSEREHEQVKREHVEAQEAKRETSAASPVPETGAVRDAWITTATKTRLLADGRVPALDVNVDTRDGVVTLFGIVPDDEAKKAAEEDARQASGVKSVENDLQVVPKSQQSRVASKDDDVERSSTKALEGRTDLGSVDVDVKNGVARLTGTVPSQSARLSAGIVVRAVDGVRAVENDLQVKSSAAASIGGGGKN